MAAVHAEGRSQLRDDALFERAGARRPISGRLPVSLAPYHNAGDGTQRPVR